METLFNEVLKLSIKGTFIILAVLLIRLFLRRMPVIFSYVSWIIPAICLLIPVNFTGLWGLLPDIMQDRHGTLPEAKNGYGILHKAAETTLKTQEFIINKQNLPCKYAGQGIFYYLSFIWILGVIFLLCYGIISYIRLFCRLKVSIRLKDNVYMADFIPAGFVMGIIKPVIYISSALNQEEQKYVILHERAHIKRHDYIFIIMAYAVLCIHWFNPVAWLGFSKFVQDMEMSCDEKVIKETGRKDRKKYAGIIIQMAGSKVCPGMMAMFNNSNLKRRVKNIMRNKKNTRKAKVMAGTAIAIAAVILIPGPAKTGKVAQAGQQLIYMAPENIIRGKANKNKVTENGLIYTKEKVMYSDGKKHTYPGYLCSYEINNPGYCKYSVPYLEKLFKKTADKWSVDVPLATDSLVMYFDQEKSDKLAKENLCDIVIQADFEIPESKDQTPFKPGIYKKYNYYLSKNKDGKWIVK